MPGKKAERPSRGIDFDAFYRDRWAELRQVFAGATFYGVDPDDVTQETMLRAREQSADSFASADALFGWCTVVGGRLIDRQRRRRRESPGLAGLEGQPDYRSAAPEELAIANFELARVLEKLPPNYVRPLILGAAGHTAPEIAKILKVSPDAAEKLLTRARKAAREGWAKAVALLVLGVGAVRRLFQSAPAQAQALFVGVATVSLVAALVFPPVPLSGSHPAPAKELGAAPMSALGVKTAASRPSSAASSPAINSSHVSSRAKQWPNVRTPAPQLVPPVSETCGPRVCMGAGCPDEEQISGDRVYLRPTGDPCGVHVTEGVTPVCEYVPDNPVVGCQRDGDPPWKASPPPLQSPPGGPL